MNYNDYPSFGVDARMHWYKIRVDLLLRDTNRRFDEILLDFKKENEWLAKKNGLTLI